jgi:hypothetical protein
VAVIALGRPILLMCIGTRDMMRDPNLVKERMKLLKLTTPSWFEQQDFFVKQSFNKSLELLELLKDFIFVIKQIDPSKIAKSHQ